MKNENIKEIKMLSHNINTPLTTIMGYAGMIHKEISKKEEGSKMAKWAELIEKEALKVAKYSKTINSIVSKILPD